jgi:hypothetical protein
MRKDARRNCINRFEDFRHVSSAAKATAS